MFFLLFFVAGLAASVNAGFDGTCPTSVKYSYQSCLRNHYAHVQGIGSGYPDVSQRKRCDPATQDDGSMFKQCPRIPRYVYGYGYYYEYQRCYPRTCYGYNDMAVAPCGKTVPLFRRHFHYYSSECRYRSYCGSSSGGHHTCYCKTKLCSKTMKACYKHKDEFYYD